MGPSIRNRRVLLQPESHWITLWYFRAVPSCMSCNLAFSAAEMNLYMRMTLTALVFLERASGCFRFYMEVLFVSKGCERQQEMSKYAISATCWIRSSRLFMLIPDRFHICVNTSICVFACGCINAPAEVRHGGWRRQRYGGRCAGEREDNAGAVD